MGDESLLVDIKLQNHSGLFSKYLFHPETFRAQRVALTVIAPEKVSVHTLLCLNFQFLFAYRVPQGW